MGMWSCCIAALDVQGALCAVDGVSGADLAQSAPSAYSELTISGVVTLQNVVAQPGYWTAQSSSGLQYYPCPIPSACTQVCFQSAPAPQCYRMFDTFPAAFSPRVCMCAWLWFMRRVGTGSLSRLRSGSACRPCENIASCACMCWLPCLCRVQMERVPSVTSATAASHAVCATSGTSSSSASASLARRPAASRWERCWALRHCCCSCVACCTPFASCCRSTRSSSDCPCCRCVCASTVSSSRCRLSLRGRCVRRSLVWFDTCWNGCPRSSRHVARCTTSRGRRHFSPSCQTCACSLWTSFPSRRVRRDCCAASPLEHCEPRNVCL